MGNLVGGDLRGDEESRTRDGMHRRWQGKEHPAGGLRGSAESDGRSSGMSTRLLEDAAVAG
ncbi:MAG: hypothetical protein KDA58_00505 [Planctomycetaceae bacterium]|nr:hypothetical protein [Planctomycetaceae bacterium]